MIETDTSQLKDLILRTVKVYNKYRSPEATAKLVMIDKNDVIVDFEGSFCMSCGVRDYFEDFIYEMETINKKIKIELADAKPTGPQNFRVNYKIKENSSKDINDSLFRKFLLERGLSFEEYRRSNSCTKDVIMFNFRTWVFERKQEKNDDL